LGKPVSLIEQGQDENREHADAQRRDFFDQRRRGTVQGAGRIEEYRNATQRHCAEQRDERAQPGVTEPDEEHNAPAHSHQQYE
jgi:hypothetical protein